MAMWPEMGRETMQMGTPLHADGQASFPPMGVIDAPTSQALSWCQPLDLKMQSLSSRVQKLERSRGQINKDIADMLKEAQEWRRKESNVKRSAATGAASSDSSEPAKLPLQRSVTALPGTASSGGTTPLAAGSLMPPPGLGAGGFVNSEQQLTVSEERRDGKTVHKVKWRIDRVETKFRDCIGRPLVSQPFEVKDKVNLPELRLMVFPNLGEDISGLTMKEQKSRFEARIKDGLSGALKLKVVNNFGDKLNITFNLLVGNERKGPLTHDFADRIIHGEEFSNNWLKEFGNESLVVGVEILGVNEDA